MKYKIIIIWKYYVCYKFNANDDNLNTKAIAVIIYSWNGFSKRLSVITIIRDFPTISK